jgi:protoheme IX farnesyltransferase
MFRPPYVARAHAIRFEDVCASCAGRLLQKPACSPRYFSGTSKAKNAAAGPSQPLKRTYFWANLVKSRQSLGKGESFWTRSYAPDKRRAQSTAAFSATHAPTESHPVAAQEAPHRRRKRLKEEAAEAEASEAEASDAEQLPPDASSTLSRAASEAPSKSLKRTINTYLALTKPRLAFLIVLTTTASYSIYPVPGLLSTSVTAAPSLSTLTLGFLTSGTFLAIASANTLNMLFEPAHDAKMSRTKNRPLVRGLISKRAAFLFALATGALGTSILWYGVNPTTAILGAANIGIYAFAYTPLKRIHPVNTWVGAIVGGIPPLMGWCAAASQYSTTNTSLTSPASIWAESQELLFTQQATGGWLLAALLFAWQFPHFFALSHAVRFEYAGAGYRMLTSTNIPMAARVSLRYSLAMFPICAGLSYYDVTDPSFLVTSSVINAWMLKEAVRFWRLNGEKGSARALFWASVWQLPIVLVLGMVQKKGLWERVWRGIFGEEEFDEWEEDE